MWLTYFPYECHQVHSCLLQLPSGFSKKLVTILDTSALNEERIVVGSGAMGISAAVTVADLISYGIYVTGISISRKSYKAKEDIPNISAPKLFGYTVKKDILGKIEVDNHDSTMSMHGLVIKENGESRDDMHVDSVNVSRRKRLRLASLPSVDVGTERIHLVIYFSDIKQ